MYHRVFLAAVLAKVLQYGFHVCLRQNLCQVIHQPSDTVIKFGASDSVK
jgi:hypothetical protein